MSTGTRSLDCHPLALEACSCSPETIRVLEAPLRRQVLAVLLERNTVEFEELTAELSLHAESSRSGDDADDQQAVVAALYHTHVPKLEAAGLLSVNDDDDVLTLRLHRDIYAGPLTPHLLRTVDQAVWSALATVYRDRRRGRVLTLLAKFGPTLTVSSLASALVESQAESAGRSAGHDSETKRDVEISLHHVHLPILDEAGLLDYDHDNRTVTDTGTQLFELADFVETLPPRMRPAL